MKQASVDIAFKAWFNSAQPLFAAQSESGEHIYEQALFRELRRQVEAAYRAGWEDSKNGARIERERHDNSDL